MQLVTLLVAAALIARSSALPGISFPRGFAPPDAPTRSLAAAPHSPLRSSGSLAPLARATHARPVQPPNPARLPTTAPVDLEVLRLQVMLDRAGFSPGVIDGRMGYNTREAQAEYQQQAGATELPPVERPLVLERITNG